MGTLDARLEEHLDGIASKSDIMALLEKLIIRWHLTAEQILITAPIVGHQWMKTPDKQAIWEWLRSTLGPTKSIFLTRPATRTSYKTLLQEDGLDYKLLEQYGLENMLIGAGLAKQDFHAKFYAGLSSNSVDVLSGSANLVRGASVENMAFRTISRHSFQQRYLAKLNISLPTPPAESNLFALLYLADEGWRATDHSGSPLDS